MQVIESFVGDNADSHIHNVTFGNGLCLTVGIKGFAKERHRCRCGRGGKGNKELIEVMLAYDLCDAAPLHLLHVPRRAFHHYGMATEWQRPSCLPANDGPHQSGMLPEGSSIPSFF